jgi:hypothetical protein
MSDPIICTEMYRVCMQMKILSQINVHKKTYSTDSTTTEYIQD